MQNIIPKFRQNSVVSETPTYLPEKSKTLTNSNNHRVKYFCWDFAHVSYLILHKGVRKIFYFLDVELLINTKETAFCECAETSFFIFANKLKHIQIKTNPGYSFVDIGMYETCAKFQPKIFNSMVAGARQSFHLFRWNTWLLGNNMV